MELGLSQAIFIIHILWFINLIWIHLSTITSCQDKPVMYFKFLENLFYWFNVCLKNILSHDVMDFSYFVLIGLRETLDSIFLMESHVVYTMLVHIFKFCFFLLIIIICMMFRLFTSCFVEQTCSKEWRWNDGCHFWIYW